MAHIPLTLGHKSVIVLATLEVQVTVFVGGGESWLAQKPPVFEPRLRFAGAWGMELWLQQILSVSGLILTLAFYSELRAMTVRPSDMLLNLQGPRSQNTGNNK